jgi:AcrR family transcriptional regulator
MGDGSNRRRRRSPAEAEREILDAAERFLRERPLRDLTIDEVMAATGLSRPAFYVYFKDRHELVLRLVQDIGAELWEMADRWLKGEGPPRADMRAAVDGIVAVYAKQGFVMKAISDGAADDPGVEQVYRNLITKFIDAATEHIKQEKKRGRVDGLNPRRTGAALVWMNERYLTECLGRTPQVKAREVSDTLLEIWYRTIYASSD